MMEDHPGARTSAREPGLHVDAVKYKGAGLARPGPLPQLAALRCYCGGTVPINCWFGWTAGPLFGQSSVFA